jgi:TolA-binding protein
MSRSFADEVGSLREAQRSARDSLRYLSQRLASLQTMTTEQFRSLENQNYQLSETMRQLGGRFARSAAAALERETPPRSDSAATPGTVPTGATPGPATLLADGIEALRSNACTTARRSFETLVSTYPNDPLSADAYFFIAESYGNCGSNRNIAAADSVYRIVGARFEGSARAPSALYKRAQLLREAGRAAEGNQLLAQVITRYPRSDEAVRACELLNRTSRCP